MTKIEHEARDIRNYLERHGFTSAQEADHIVVRDPVQVYSAGHRTEYQDVRIRNWEQAIAFVEERS